MASIVRYNIWQPSIMLDRHEEFALFAVYGSQRPRIAEMAKDITRSEWSKDLEDWSADFMRRAVLGGEPVWRSDVERINRLLESTGQPAIVFAETPRTEWMKERGAAKAMLRSQIVRVCESTTVAPSRGFVEVLAEAFLQIKQDLKQHPSLADAEAARAGRVRVAGVGADRWREDRRGAIADTVLPAVMGERTMGLR